MKGLLAQNPGQGKSKVDFHKPATALPAPIAYTFVADVCEGLERFGFDEVREKFKGQVRIFPDTSKTGEIRFSYSGDLQRFLQLKAVNAVYLVKHYDVPRPRAFLGDENFRTLTRQILHVIDRYPVGTFRSIFLSAAGSDSTVFIRLKNQLSHHLKLEIASHEGDLLIRVRRPPYGSSGWEVLVRTSPRPVSKRSWRVCDMRGALSAPVAYVMAQLSNPMPEDEFLNIACGSGTLLVERAEMSSYRYLMGVDIRLRAIRCAEANLRAKPGLERISLLQGDGRNLPFSDRRVSALCADLPFGGLVGSHSHNIELYPVLLSEAARVSRSGAVFVVLTHELKLIQSVIAQTDQWRCEEELQINLRGLHPKIYVLRRTNVSQ